MRQTVSVKGRRLGAVLAPITVIIGSGLSPSTVPFADGLQRLRLVREQATPRSLSISPQIADKLQRAR